MKETNVNSFSKIGYDYGLKPFFMMVSDVEFSELFKQAECNGILYFFGMNKDEIKIPVQIAFLFKNEKPAEKFLDILMNWIEKSNNDGDAVTIDFIENNDGGYTIAISPEVNRFINRMTPHYLIHKVTPIVMIMSHFKKIDTLSQNYLNFRTNYMKADKISIGYVIGTPNNFEKQSKKYFNKKVFNFYKEDEIPTDTMTLGYIATQKNSTFDPAKLPEPPRDSIEEISQRRIKEMKLLLPLTYHKLNNLWLGEIQKKLSSSYDREIIIQAICNLTIFERLKEVKDLSTDFTQGGYPNRILDYLLSTYESFDSYYPPDDFYTEENIISQIENDKNELQSYLSK